MKIEYQRESFKEVIEEEFVSKKFDAFAYKEQLKDRARESAGVSKQFKDHLYETLSKNGLILDRVLQKSPFSKETPEYQNLKISILLNSIQALKNKIKLEVNNQGVILWHLPKSMANYAKILLKEFFMELKLEIMDCYAAADLSDMELENILDSAPEVLYNEEQY
jgi:hypothetical protein